MIRLPILLALLSACITSAPAAKALTPQSQAEEAAIATAIQQIESKRSDYHISNADLINVSVLGEKDMDRQIRVSQSGTITYPLIGAVKVGGLSASEAEAAIATKLNDYLRGAQVNKPGAIEIPT